MWQEMDGMGLLRRRYTAGSQADHRRRLLSRLRAEGRYGPTLGEVLLPLSAVVLGIALPVGGLVWLGAALGWWAPLLLLCTAASAVLWLRQRRARTALTPVPAPAPVPATPAGPPLPVGVDQIDQLDDAGYRAAVAAMLSRDHWTVREIEVGEAVHLVGQHDVDGTQIGLACVRGTVNPAAPAAAALRPVGAPPAGAPTGALWMMVSTGHWDRPTVRWAIRTNVRLIDRGQLQRWCQGEDLADLLDLHADHPLHQAR